MNRRLWIATAALVLGAIVWFAWPRGADRFAALHQARDEPVPGALGYTLEPVGGFRPAIDPRGAYRGLVGASQDRDVSVTLAMVRYEGGVTYGPAWVFFTRDLCFFEAKGDFVSVSRSGVGDGCSPSNLLVQMVDAESGEELGVFPGYDVKGGWLPDRLGESAQALGTTLFH